MLTHITVTACPDCGCTKIRSMQRRDQHTNGQWNEELEFDCGQHYRHFPYGGQPHKGEGCRLSPAQRAIKDKNRAYLDGLRKAAETTPELSPKFQARLLDELKRLDFYC